MARPAKAVKVQSGAITKDKKNIRKKTEDAFTKGSNGELPEVPEYLTDRQKAIFLKVRDMLAGSGYLIALDEYVLATLAIALDRLQEIEEMIDAEPANLQNTSLLSAKDKYTKDFFRCCNELCLSPQARAKMGCAAASVIEKKKDRLSQILNESD